MLATLRRLRLTAAAALVPPELQPLARAASLLGYRTAQDRGVRAAVAEPPLHLQANR